MKNLVIILLLILLIGCSKEGEIHRQSKSVIIINGNNYRFIEVTPTDGANPVWILVPENADIKVPSITAQRVSCGKNCVKLKEVIFIEN